MNDGEKRFTRKHGKHLRVPVLPDEEEAIRRNAANAGMSTARFLREIGQGYRIRGIVDYERVLELARINGDLGRLGGLLKLWLSNDRRLAGFTPATIRTLLSKIETAQDELRSVMKEVMRR
ncbi:conjugal transfer transcriptional regulator TraJ [Paraburkholderia bonniea]|uniref:conjugal transfer transcriptional regulator TraJ n=1 Tax=Paraburkholderia bonniea TaxID=2152891 RepID=UPI0025737FC6|nr:conjugal transfer transcriptional regulator TraJ [Paraburkholderia bonniea]WJF90213.1 conjugal transfer transcriptional regulator TraJ [Paraburkholderia bonniea]WJF93527.1 conjugal transfer transcriptional regulator TraJ [Paraburkholderia bonniea]